MRIEFKPDVKDLPDVDKKIARLEARLAENRYIDGNGMPLYDAEAAMNDHVELAEIYAGRSNHTESREHFDRATTEFSFLARSRTKQPDYVTGRDGHDNLMQRNLAIEGELEAHKTRLWDLGEKLGYEPIPLMEKVGLVQTYGG